jgi:hypothetical protein
MSFSNDVKNELCRIKETSKAARKVLLHGMLYGMKKSSMNEQAFILLKELAGEFDIKITDSRKVKDSINITGDRGRGLFLRGVFLTCGTVSDPGKNYHLELNLSDEKKLDILYNLINEIGLTIKKSIRKSRPLLYIKESELISDFLTYIGAGVNSMEIMNTKIYKEVRNNINRAVNCEAANIGKTARAAGKQIADIEYIYSKKGPLFLPSELKTIADIRLQNFEMSLKEIGEMCEPRLSRSGVFHRLEKICNIAEKLRNENG